MPRGLRRRDLLKLGALSLALPRAARAIGEGSKLRIAQLMLGESWNPRPTALKRLQWEVHKRTSIDTALDPVALTLADDRLFQFPFLYLAGDRGFDLPPGRDLDRLRRHLTFGGFLVTDSAEGRVGGSFDAAVRRLASSLFPRPSLGLQPLPGDHVISKSFYLVERAQGRLAISPQLDGVSHDGREVLVSSQNDLGGAWARNNFGTWEHECYPGGEAQREMAFRLGINLVMYALCLDYKTDQVHVPFILKRRKWNLDR